MGWRTVPALALALAMVVSCSAVPPPPARAVLISPSPPATTPTGGVPVLPVTPIPNPATLPDQAGHNPNPFYTAGTHGYDVSYPQCSVPRAPEGAAFAIVGVNDGKAFTINPCLAQQWGRAKGARALYLNSGYNPDREDRVTSDCRGLSGRLQVSEVQRTAYAIGCSQTVYAVGTARVLADGAPMMWWLDVEAVNSWDENDLNLNRFALQGEIDQLVALGRPVGLYSTFSSWQAIVGDWSPPGVVADWVAGRPAALACSGPGFSGHPVWLVQDATPWPDPADIDSDWAC